MISKEPMMVSWQSWRRKSEGNCFFDRKEKKSKIKNMKKQAKNTTKKAYGFGEVMLMLESMNDGIAVVSEQYGDVVRRLDQIQDDLADIKHDLKRKVSYDEFAKLENRTIKLEKLVFSKLA